MELALPLERDEKREREFQEFRHLLFLLASSSCHLLLRTHHVFCTIIGTRSRLRQLLLTTHWLSSGQHIFFFFRLKPRSTSWPLLPYCWWCAERSEGIRQTHVNTRARAHKHTHTHSHRGEGVPINVFKSWTSTAPAHIDPTLEMGRAASCPDVFWQQHGSKISLWTCHLVQTNSG